MRIRDYRESDEPILQAIHAKQAFGYDFPDLKSPLFIEKRVLVDGNDVPRQVILTKLTTEAYFLTDPEWETPGMRLEAFTALHEDIRSRVAAHGIEDVNAWIPPKMEKPFGRRLMERFGWKESLWKHFFRETR